MTELLRTPSKPFYDLLDKIADNEKTTKESFQAAVTLARQEKFTDLEIALLMKDYLREKVPRRTLSGWVKELEPTDDIDNSSVESGQSAQIDENKDPEESDSVEDIQETVKNLPVKDSTQFYQELKKDREGEEPTAEELAEIKQSIERPQPQPKQQTLDEIFNSLPDDGAITTWKIDKISGMALKNRISSWQGTSMKHFRVWMQEV